PNPARLAVVGEALDLRTPEAFAHLERLAGQLAHGLREAIADAGTAAIVQNVGPTLQVFFLAPGSEDIDAIRDARDFSRHVDRERFRAFAHALFDEGVYLSPSAALHSVLATVHTPAEVERVVHGAGAARAHP